MDFFKKLASNLLDDQEHFTDLTQVAVVDAESCISVLSKRYEKDAFYTHCGPLLVAVNPYKRIPDLYSEERLDEYAQLVPADAPAPHAYEMAARAYTKMMAHGVDQSIVITGESGAGKTETAKFLLAYLTHVASSSSSSTLQERVVGANPIMESFGCAQTVRNDNSSRFGKFVQLLFTKSGRLAGASMTTYLLEKARVSHISAGECNFHIFHEMCAGLGATERATCRVGSAPSSQFAYLAADGARSPRDDESDARKLGGTRRALVAVGVEPAALVHLMQLLAGILHLGNVRFGSHAEDEATCDADHALANVAALLQVDGEALATGLCCRRFKAGQEWVTTRNSVALASDVRHALGRSLYSSLFSAICAQINASLAGGAEVAAAGGGGMGPSLGYVDIFGFEIFPRNGLEQLCINFANEKLQRLFLGVLFDETASRYEREGVQVEPVPYDDNTAVVALIGGSSEAGPGLFGMLAEECVFPKGSDASYLHKLQGACRKSPSFVSIKTSVDSFGVLHYAGEVTYCVEGFLSKNKDPVNHDLQALMGQSQSAFISKLTKEHGASASVGAVAKPGAKRFGSGKFVGVVDHFHASLRAMITALEAGDLHFIRCLKPNDEKRADKLETHVLERQLVASGLVQAVQASRAGFSDHLPPAHLVAQFSMLAAEQSESGEAHGISAEELLRTCGVEEDGYAIGHTKVFLRQGILQELQRQRLEWIGLRAVHVQALMRGTMARREAARRREERARAAELARRREEEARRRAEEEARLLREAEERRLREEEEARLREEEAKRRVEAVQKARALSFQRRAKKKAIEEEERRAADEAALREARRKAADLKRAEQEAEMRERLAKEGVDVNAPNGGVMPGGADGAAPLDGYGAGGAVLAGGAEEEGASGAASKPSVFTLRLPDSPSTSRGPSGQPSPHLPPGASGSADPRERLAARLLLSGEAASFTSPLDDIISYADYIGMNLDDDSELLWIADEALQAPEPVGWEECQDPMGNSYYMNNITQMTMTQHPVDYHYQQFYLQMKQQKMLALHQAHPPAAAPAAARKGGGMMRTPRRTTNAAMDGERPVGGGRGSKFQLDLRSIDTDGDDLDGGGQTPVGWLRRTKSMLTPRGGSPFSSRRSRNIAAGGDASYECVHITAVVTRAPGVSLGMELNAYNQILSLVPGSPCAEHPDVALHDRVLSIDGEVLGDRLLSETIRAGEAHTLTLERWVAKEAEGGGSTSRGSLARALSPRSLLSLSRSQSKGDYASTPASGARGATPKRGKRPPMAPGAASPAAALGARADRFQVVLQRGSGGLGLVCDEDGVVTDLVPGSAADVQSQYDARTKRELRVREGDRIVCVDGVPLDGNGIDAVLTPAEKHVLLVERERKDELVTKHGTNPLTKALRVMTPRGGAGGSPAGVRGGGALAARQPVLRQVHVHKETVSVRLGIRFVRDDEGFDRAFWRGDEACVQPIVAALDPQGEATAAGLEVDDMVLSINGQTGLSNTQAAALLRDLTGDVSMVVRKATWTGVPEQEAEGGAAQMPETPRAAMRRLV